MGQTAIGSAPPSTHNRLSLARSTLPHPISLCSVRHRCRGSCSVVRVEERGGINTMCEVYAPSFVGAS